MLPDILLRNKKIFPNSLKHKAKQIIASFNSLTASLRMNPSFFIVGIQKGGTTSLYNYLIQHPQVTTALHKEIYFFNQFYDQGINWYKGNFPIAKTISGQKQITGEATPTYLYSRNAALRIKEFNENAKIIMILRDPVSRAYSDFNYGVKLMYQNQTPPSLTARMEKELTWLEQHVDELEGPDDYAVRIRKHCAYVGPGLYAYFMGYWWDTFGKDNVLVLSSEYFFQNTKEAYDKVLNFLDLDKSYDLNFKVHNKNHYQNIDHEMKERLQRFYAPHNERLFELLGEKFDW